MVFVQTMLGLEPPLSIARTVGPGTMQDVLVKGGLRIFVLRGNGGIRDVLLSREY